MGACASKPKELKEELAPQPQPAVEGKADVIVQEKVIENVADDIDDNKRKSLGQIMFIESEESKVASETEEVAVKETIPLSEPVEAKEEQASTEEPLTVEKFVIPTPEEVSAPSEATTEEKHVDLSANAELPVPTEKVNAELPVPTSSTEEVVDESNTENVVAESPKTE